MNTTAKLFGTLFTASAIILTGCKKDENLQPEPAYTAPTTYTFTNSDGESTVSFSGQIQRLTMMSELSSYMKTANTLGTIINADTLKAMFDNTYTSWTDGDNLGLVGSSKQLKNKTAAGDVGVQNMIEDYMDSISKLSTLNIDNSTETYGASGVWTNGTKAYLQSGTGLEYTQLIEKTLMCAVSMNQMTVNYLGTLSDDENTVVEDGKTYTEMQHHWDEAYGYFTSAVDYPANGTNAFWGKYANGREAILGSATKLAEAFRNGRAAIDNQDYAVRDEQIIIIRNEIEKVCAASAIHYLNATKAIIGQPTLVNHQLTEARAFINGLRYGYNSSNGISISSSEINTALGYIGTDFSTITIEKINNAIDLIASKVDLVSVKSSL